MSSKVSYYAKDERCDSKAVLLSHDYGNSVSHILPPLAKSVQTKSIGRGTSSVVYVINETSTVGNWSPQLKLAVSAYKEAKIVFEQSNNRAELQPSPQSYSPIHKTHRRIAELGADNETYKYTTEWLKRLRKIVVANQMWWGEPLVNLSIDSEIVFEWWHGTKKLTVYILRNTAEYIKVWGTDIDNEMEDGTSSSPAELTALWKWLVS
ncbi:hypothetical protein [uncultured Nostoc sp.]|uniref:hypothetical protein n=1 Tax=uncultured Nostoc sp. TaxID=340711 RepID=UPI0035CC190D